MSIKTAVKDHFASAPISRHLKTHLDCLHGLNSFESSFDNGNLLIRKFTIQDMDKCAKLYKEVFSTYPWYDNWVSLEQARTYLIELIENPVFEGYVAYSGLKLVAVCFGHRKSWWMGKELFIDEFYVRNESQGGGIGTKMMDYIKKQLIKEEYVRLVLLTNKGIPAESFYLKNGFYTANDRTVMIKVL